MSITGRFQGETSMNSVSITKELHDFEKQAVIKVCGIGGGGGNAVGRMIEAGLKDVEFITINTDAQSLRSSPAGTRLQIGSSGLGAGAKPEVAAEAAKEHRDRVAEVLAGADMIFLTAGLGGGTGTGATPIVAEVARESGALTVGIVTMPFRFEGQERMGNANRGLAELEKHVDALIVVPNDRLALFCNDNNITFLNAFRQADEVLHNGVRAISDLITVPGLINLDFADCRTIMHSSGRALMGIGTADGENRARRAAADAIVCPLLENQNIEGALGVLVNVTGGADIGMREVLEAVTTVQRAAHPNANIIFGAVIDEEERAEVSVTVIAAGYSEEALEKSRHSSERLDEMLAEVLGPDNVPQRSSEPIPFRPRREESADSFAVDEVKVELETDGGQDFEPPNIEDEALDAASVDWEEGKGEQILIPDDAQPPVAEQEEELEDMDIPAFMRRRMRDNA